MITNSYLHIPKNFCRFMREPIVLNDEQGNEEPYLYWGVKPTYTIEDELDNHYTIPINHQESVSIDDNYNYSDLSININTVSQPLFNILLNGAKKVLIIVDFDNIPRTPFISSANRILTTNMYRITLSLKPFNCYRLHDVISNAPKSEYVSHKVISDVNTLTFDPPYELSLSQVESEIETLE